MTDKDFAVRAFLCRMDDNKEKPSFECLICPYGKGCNISDDDRPEDVVCNLSKLYDDIISLIKEWK